MDLNKIATHIAADSDLALEGPFKILDNTDDYIEIEVGDLEIPKQIVPLVKEYFISQGVSEGDFEEEGGEEKEDSPIYFYDGKAYVTEGSLQLDKNNIEVFYEAADPGVGVSEDTSLDGYQINAINHILLENPIDVKKADRFYREEIKSNERDILEFVGAFDAPEPDYDPGDDYW